MRPHFLIVLLSLTHSAAAAPELALWRDGSIMLVDCQTRAQRPLVDAAADKPVQWCPDGKSLLFWKREGVNQTLWRIDLESKAQHCLSKDIEGGVRSAALSPDGHRIAMIGNGGLWVTDAQGTNPLRLSTDGYPQETPAWSADGKWLVYADLGMRDESEADKVRMDLYVVGVDGRGRRRLVFSNGSCDSAHWVGSTKVVYCGVRRGNSEICLYDLSAARETNLTQTPEEESLPRPSPDGSRIAWWKRVGDTHELWVWSDGKPTRLAHVKQTAVHPVAWSADGKWLAYVDGDSTSLLAPGADEPINLGKGSSQRFR